MPSENEGKSKLKNIKLWKKIAQGSEKLGWTVGKHNFEVKED